jgi:hypothetical protein
VVGLGGWVGCGVNGAECDSRVDGMLTVCVSVCACVCVSVCDLSDWSQQMAQSSRMWSQSRQLLRWEEEDEPGWTGEALQRQLRLGRPRQEMGRSGCHRLPKGRSRRIKRT